MLQNLAVAFAIIVAVVVTLKAIIDVKEANKVLDKDEADEASHAPYKVEKPMEEYPVEEVTQKIVESNPRTQNRVPANTVAAQESAAKPKRKRRKKTPVVPPAV